MLCKCKGACAYGRNVCESKEIQIYKALVCLRVSRGPVIKGKLRQIKGNCKPLMWGKQLFSYTLGF